MEKQPDAVQKHENVYAAQPQTYNKTIKAWFHRVLLDSASCAIFGDSTGSSYG